MGRHSKNYLSVDLYDTWSQIFDPFPTAKSIELIFYNKVCIFGEENSQVFDHILSFSLRWLGPQGMNHVIIESCKPMFLF